MRAFHIICYVGVAFTASSIVANEPTEEIIDERIFEEQYKEAALECRLEVFQNEQDLQEKEIEELQVDNRLLEQQNNYFRQTQKHQDEEHTKRRREESKWERDHARE